MARTQGWLEHVRLRNLTPEAATLEAQSAALRDAARAQEREVLQALASEGWPVARLRWTVRKRARAANPSGMRRLHLQGERLNPAVRLRDFLTGPSNDAALRLAKSCVEQPGLWSPVAFYGGSGNGKSHLLHAIGNGYRRRYPGRRVVLSSGERFVRHFVHSTRGRPGGGAAFREFYRGSDLLILDDVQDVAGRPGSEQELVFTLDSLQRRGAQVIVACSESPKQLGLQEALAGRLLGGMSLKVESPNRTTCLEVLRARQATRRLSLSGEVQELLMDACSASMRDLLCSVNRLEAYQRHVERELDLSTARHVLQDLLRRQSEPATLEGLAGFVADQTGASLSLQCGRSRKPDAVRARQLSMALARHLTGLTLREVGEFFGRRSCAAVHLAQQRVREQRGRDGRLQELWEGACARFTRAETHAGKDTPTVLQRPGKKSVSADI
ncbi:MAG: DnaA/Hda family protein [Planctomycetota bacterium]